MRRRDFIALLGGDAVAFNERRGTDGSINASVPPPNTLHLLARIAQIATGIPSHGGTIAFTRRLVSEAIRVIVLVGD